MLARGGSDDVLDERQEGRLAGPRRHGQVERVPLAVARSNVAERTRPRPERILVDAGEEDLALAVEDHVRPVAVVDVPVEDKHPLCSQLVEGVAHQL